VALYHFARPNIGSGFAAAKMDVSLGQSDTISQFATRYFHHKSTFLQSEYISSVRYIKQLFSIKHRSTSTRSMSIFILMLELIGIWIKARSDVMELCETVTWSWSNTSGTALLRNVIGVLAWAFSLTSARYESLRKVGISSLTSVMMTVTSVFTVGGGETALDSSVAWKGKGQ